MKLWDSSELCPDYVKIDRHFISGIDKDPVKREFVRAMLDIAHRIGHKAIAEGIETETEFSTLVAMGVEYAQGYFIARPAAAPATELSGQVKTLSVSSLRRYQDHFVRTAGEIVVNCASVSPQTSAETLVKMFRADMRLTCVPVVDDETALGMVSRAEILNIFSHRFAHELYAQKAVKEFISPLSIIVDVGADLKAVGQLISEDPQQNLSVDFIVCDQERYLGVGKVRDLLRSITEEKLRLARHSNPLAQLRCEAMLGEFIAASATLLPEQQRDYWSHDRQGLRQKFGPLTLAIGCVSPDINLCRTHHEVSQLLADAKHSAKMLGGNQLFYSRRSKPQV